ncbi:hypothetical protein C0991_007495 [Blastosporella zonata]|nr:hypothetical protein C0991_007495 [Blastosporella zonata]
MIFQTPKKLIAMAKAFSPWSNMSPARLFASAPVPESESVILDPPTWPEDLSRDYCKEVRGGPVNPRSHLKRCYGPNGSFHRSMELKQLNANRAYNLYHHKRQRYESQQLKIKAEEARIKPIPFPDLHRQAIYHLADSNDPEDKIFLAEFERLRNLPDNFEKWAQQHEKLEKQRDRSAYEKLVHARGVERIPSFSTCQRARRAKAAEKAAEKAAAKNLKRKMSMRVQLNSEEEQEKERRKERERKRREYEEEKTRLQEEGRKIAEQVRTQGHREEIRLCLEQGRPIPTRLQHRKALIEEITHIVREAARLKEEAAAAWAAVEHNQRRLRAEALRQREAATAQFTRFQAELAAREQAKQEAQRRMKQEEAERRCAEKAAREEEARRAQEAHQAQEEARQAQEEARQAQEEAHRQAQQQAGQTAHDELAQHFQIYDTKWAALRGTETYSDIIFSQFPWPVLGNITDISFITLKNVAEFYKVRGTEGKAMKAEILKWHPDKLNNQLYQVRKEHREQVREAGELVAKFLNTIKGGKGENEPCTHF